MDEKYNLMEISKDKLDQIGENTVGSGVHVGLLYGMPIILYGIGRNTPQIQEIVSDLSKYNHPSLALNYGFLIDKQSEDYQESDKVYIVRELVKGKNFHNIVTYHIHDRLVLLYKLICLMEFLHSFDVYYLFLHPSKIIITDDLEIKVVDHIKVNEDVLNNLKLQSLNDESRFIIPELFSSNFKLDKVDSSALLYADLYSFGCLLFYSVVGELPWSKMENKEDILKFRLQNELKSFLDNEENYPDEIKKVYTIIDKLLNNKYSTTEQVRVEIENLSEVQDYIKNGTLMFDFEEESKKVIESIEELIGEIDKLYDDNSIPRHFNTIHQPNTKLKFSNHHEVDFTKAKNSVFEITNNTENK